MAKDKKRGFFSWLGFGQKEQPEEPKVETQEAVEQAEPEVEAADIAPQTPTPVEQTEPVLAEQAEDARVLLDDTTEPVADAKAADTAEPSITEPELAQNVVSESAEQEVFQAHQERIVTEEVTAIESIISHAGIQETPEVTPVEEPVETVTHAAAVQERIVTEEVAAIESMLPHAEATSQAEVIEPVVAPIAEIQPEEPVAEVVEPIVAPVAEIQPEEPVTEVVAPLVAESPTDDSPVEEPVAEVIEPVIAPLVAESPLETSPENAPEEPVVAPIVEQEKPTKEGFFARLKRSLVKTKQNLGSGFMALFRGKKIDDDLFEELEEQLLIADVGVETTRKIIEKLTETASRKQLRDAEALYALLKEEMSEILAKVDAPLKVEGKKPFVILMVGVNGVGKTTTIGKLARQFELEGKSVMLAAGDTFRAAAVEQLQVWGDRNNIPVIAQHTGADSASVIFDAIQAAKARNIDVLIADTAGRLQNKSHLMEELKKIVRVMKKLDEEAPHEIMLTLDASTGQNAISQAKLFHEAVGLTGITLTKLDGTAKGGVIFSIADQFSIPIRYIGVGEQLADLRPFNSEDFIEALFARED
ncbi:signal recognition particle-docking protein FtsY [Klebsiella sp. BIGb0407]|uniref:signal recognition particle-docking protein FtsY n=1 Tax=Klebsiella sp. BIGb0407 TaxID=2940603 RepID=UPI0021683DA4|nr:signal recognition particle-docking protein FtsY [Klebsiella sp. BIGb0407]MCS3432790.1 fused signal recognition particle receptor [Klebsiella sp. BIGb0407]